MDHTGDEWFDPEQFLNVIPIGQCQGNYIGVCVPEKLGL